MAGAESDVELVSEVRKLSRSVVKPAKHEGWHTVGRRGVEAAAGGNGGIEGGGTTAGGVEHALVRSGSSHQISIVMVHRNLSNMLHLLGGVRAPLVLDPLGRQRLVSLALLLLLVGHEAVMLALPASVVGRRAGQPNDGQGEQPLDQGLFHHRTPLRHKACSC